ncbi:hypothetical protein MKK67_31430 [Methylobacterium sp. J-072]|uniref:hypothetical protein n=1 Tax=Methylobacterium sp. J-072 TaxID=2836651 RepID=UPI001FBACBE2|nr:hypothetical protein [Methylobacterium sp. J-072]MCJ2096992.1 hypothetical protein [Methylobacterium sp. J-072]
MDTYCVTFRIADRAVNGKSYSERRDKLVENVRSKGGGYWDETTSFFLVESNLNTPSFAAQAADGLSEQYDMLFVFDPKDMSACYFGAVTHVDVLRSFFPKIQKVK